MMVCDWHIIQLDRMSILCIANYITLESFNANYIDLKIKHSKSSTSLWYHQSIFQWMNY
jgi:hypothetical protein